MSSQSQAGVVGCVCVCHSGLGFVSFQLGFLRCNRERLRFDVGLLVCLGISVQLGDVSVHVFVAVIWDNLLSQSVCLLYMCWSVYDVVPKVCVFQGSEPTG